MEECCAAELRSIDFYPVNSEKELLEVVARIEKLKKGKIECKNKKDYNRIEQEKMDQLRSIKLHDDDKFFVVCLTNERRLALFPARTIVRDPHHRKSLTSRE